MVKDYTQRNAMWAKACGEIAAVVAAVENMRNSISEGFLGAQMPSRIVLRSLGDLPWPQQITRRALKRRLRGRHGMARHAKQRSL